jgi:hypothetical protein
MVLRGGCLLADDRERGFRVDVDDTVANVSCILSILPVRFQRTSLSINKWYLAACEMVVDC